MCEPSEGNYSPPDRTIRQRMIHAEADKERLLMLPTPCPIGFMRNLHSHN